MTAAGVPSAPQALSLITSYASTITLGINPSLDDGGSPITSYKIYMDSGSLSSSFTLVAGYDGTSSTYTLTNGVEGIISGVKYRFICTAINDIGESDASDEVRFAAASFPAIPG